MNTVRLMRTRSLRVCNDAIHSLLDDHGWTPWGVQLHDAKVQIQDILRVVFGVFCYPLWLVWALVYGLWPFETPYQSFFDKHSVQSDSFTHLRALAAAKEDKAQQKSAKVPGRDKVIKSLLKVASLDSAHIASIVRGEGDMFAEDLKFTDHIVSYSNCKEWITSFHALTAVMAVKIVEIEQIRDDGDFSVVHFRLSWLTPFSFLNEHLMGGLEFKNVMVIKFDESNRVCQIDEYWNGRDHLDVMGLFGVMRRMTALVTLPMCHIMSCFTK